MAWMPRRIASMLTINAVPGIRTVWLCGLSVALAACNLDTDTSTDQPPALRVVNATTVSAVSVHLDALELPVATVASNSATPGCLLVAPTTHVVSFLQDNQVLDEFTINFARNTGYVVFLTGSGTTFRAFAIATNRSVADASNGLTLINGTSAAGDVYITGASDDPSAATRAATALAPVATATEEPPFVLAPEANLRVRLFDVAATTAPRSDITLVPMLASGQGIVVFIDRVVGTDPGAFQVDPCEEDG
jgi:hypothetical protein